MGFDLDGDKLHAWYGGNYNYEPPPPPPPATTEGGDAPPVPASWAQTHWGPKDWPGKRPGDALVMGRFLPVHRGHAWLAAEPKAERFAQLAKLEFVLVDRTTVSASGTSIRRAPWKYWNDIAPALRGPFTSCVSLVGPEGAGKTTLARKLREHFKTSLANEYTVDFLRAEGRDAPTKEELAGPIWNGQA